jgi:cytochrome c-type biogenesis protein CcmH
VIWLLFGLMLLAAVLVVAWPMYHRQRRLSPGLISSVFIVLGVSALVYSRIGTPVPPPPVASVDEMVAGLDQRLQENPDDIEGWKMLGRSYMQLENYPKAIEALERAVAMEKPANAQTLAALGEALLIGEGSTRSSRTAQLFESALAAEPTNSKALFYGGVVAIERGDRELAAERWEALLALSPPSGAASCSPRRRLRLHPLNRLSPSTSRSAPMQRPLCLPMPQSSLLPAIRSNLRRRSPPQDERSPSYLPSYP